MLRQLGLRAVPLASGRFQLAPWAAGVVVAVTVAGLVLQVRTSSTPVPLDFASREASTLVALLFGALPVLGALIERRHPKSPMGWLFIALGSTTAIWALADGYAVYGLLTRPGALPGPELAAWVANWIWISTWTVAGLMFLLFPDGRLCSPGWRPFAWIFAATGSGFAATTILAGGPLANYVFVENPLGVIPVDPPALKLAGSFVLLGLGLVTLGSLVPRARRATGEQRLQYQWLGYAGALSIVALAVGWILVGLGVEIPMIENVAQTLPVALPIAAAVAVLRYRLYDIEVVVNKTLVFGALAAFVTLVYVAIVVGIGTVVSRGDQPDLALSIAATAVVALAFEPARRRTQDLANRVVYGRRASPYDVLAAFSQRMGERPGSQELLAEMAQLLGEATGAARSEVWLRSGDWLRSAASWPDGTPRTEPQPVDGDEVRFLGPFDLAIPVRHQGELLGALTVATRPGASVRPLEVGLVADLAAQAGHVLRNVQLTEELVRRLEELQASRLRLVSAQDDERRRLERDLHDGAQQYLVALRVQLGLAVQVLDEDPEELRTTIGELEELAGEALESLRTLARGIYPPVLANQGLVAALRTHAERTHLPVRFVADDLGRYPKDAEAAVYFCFLEALQNVTKYSQPSLVEVRLEHSDDELRFTVEDDGLGFDPDVVVPGAGFQNMADRLEALGGQLEIHSRPGQGTRLSGRLPVR